MAGLLSLRYCVSQSFIMNLFPYIYKYTLLVLFPWRTLLQVFLSSNVGLVISASQAYCESPVPAYRKCSMGGIYITLIWLFLCISYCPRKAMFLGGGHHLFSVCPYNLAHGWWLINVWGSWWRQRFCFVFFNPRSIYCVSTSNRFWQYLLS